MFAGTASCGGGSAGKSATNGGIVTIATNPPAPPAESEAFIEAWNTTISTVCLATNEVYSFANPRTDDSPLTPIADWIRSELDLDVVSETEPCDATLTVNVTGRALGAKYSSIGVSYTGVIIDGTVRLSAEGQDMLINQFQISREPPAVLTSQAEVFAVSEEAAIRGAPDNHGGMARAFEKLLGCFSDCT